MLSVRWWIGDPLSFVACALRLVSQKHLRSKEGELGVHSRKYPLSRPADILTGLVNMIYV